MRTRLLGPNPRNTLVDLNPTPPCGPRRGRRPTMSSSVTPQSQRSAPWSSSRDGLRAAFRTRTGDHVDASRSVSLPSRADALRALVVQARPPVVDCRPTNRAQVLLLPTLEVSLVVFSIAHFPSSSRISPATRRGISCFKLRPRLPDVIQAAVHFFVVRPVVVELRCHLSALRDGATNRSADEKCGHYFRERKSAKLSPHVPGAPESAHRAPPGSSRTRRSSGHSVMSPPLG